MIASEKVMNNEDLRRLIWAFFKRDSRIRCSTCRQLYYKENIFTYPIYDATRWINQCKICSWTANTRDILS